MAKDGRLLKVLLSISPIWVEEGELAGCGGIFRDLSEQRRTEDALRASERRYRSVVEALNEGVVMQDANGHVLAFNKSAERILGLSAEQLAASSSDRPLVPLIHEDGSPFLGHEHPTMVSMRTGEPQSGVVMGVESPDGSMRWISINSCALTRPGESEPYAAVASFTDITESRRRSKNSTQPGSRISGAWRWSPSTATTTPTGTPSGSLRPRSCSRALGLDERADRTIHRAAPLHDVGKIGIPDSILLKPGKLTAEEFEVIKTHTVIGGRILCESHFPILKMATEIAFTHHERWDGAGYPAGLQARRSPSPAGSSP